MNGDNILPNREEIGIHILSEGCGFALVLDSETDIRWLQHHLQRILDRKLAEGEAAKWPAILGIFTNGADGKEGPYFDYLTDILQGALGPWARKRREMKDEIAPGKEVPPGPAAP